jgi:hypothetical protein
MIRSRMIRRAGHVARMEAKRIVCRILEEKTEEKRPLRRPTCWWEDIIKIDIRDITDFQGNDPIWNLDPLYGFLTGSLASTR